MPNHDLEMYNMNSDEYATNIENLKLSIFTDSDIELLSKNNFSPQLHFHAYYELFFIEKGSIILRFENEDVVLNENDLFIIAPNMPHCSVMTQTKDIKRYAFYFSLTPNSLKKSLDMYGVTKNLLKEKYIRFEACGSLLVHIKKILRCVTDNNMYYIGLYFYEMLLELLERRKMIPKIRTQNPIHSDSAMNRLWKIDHILKNNFTNNLTLETIADILFLSPRQTGRIIEKHYGVKFRELIVQMRMKKAGELLTETKKSVSSIASEMGYSTLKGFYSTFKSYYGMLPSEYRKSKKNTEN